MTSGDGGPLPVLWGRRVTDLGSLAGGAVWLTAASLSFTGVLNLSLVELFVALAVLVLVPLGLGLMPNPRAGSPSLYRFLVLMQPPAGLLAVAGMAAPVESVVSGVLVVPWLLVTISAALYGSSRLLTRGITSLPELAVNAALLYLPVAGAALLLHRSGTYLGFPPVIVLLTAVHFHYAGFALPLVTGLTYRGLLDDEDRFGGGLAGRAAAATTLVIVVNIGLIAVGITFSPVIEILAVALFTVAVAGFAALVLLRVVPRLPRLPAVLLAVASVTLFFTMALALLYGYSAYPTTHTALPGTEELVTIPWMVRLHGTMNAFGFALPALLAHWFLEGGVSE